MALMRTSGLVHYFGGFVLLAWACLSLRASPLLGPGQPDGELESTIP